MILFEVFMFKCCLRFVDTIGNQTNTSFILVTGNSDRPASYSYSQAYQTEDRLLNSPLLIAWFAENLDFTHPKVIPLPIGLENREFRGLGVPNVLSQAILPSNESRDILSYINFIPRKGRPSRGKAMKTLANISKVETDRIPHIEYTKDLRRSKFVVSPPGVGWDCHRTWESVLFGSIPIDPLRVIVSLADIDSAHNTGGKWHFEYYFKKINNKSPNGKYYFQHR